MAKTDFNLTMNVNLSVSRRTAETAMRLLEAYHNETGEMPVGTRQPDGGVRFCFEKDQAWDPEAADTFRRYKHAFELLENLTSCNDCARHKCEYLPPWGDPVRYNCPHHIPEEGKQL